MTTFRAITRLRSPLDATVSPPGSKSQTIRALVCAALADGTSSLLHALDSEDTGFARQALRQLGVEINDSADTWAVIGSHGRLHPAPGPIDAGASGLTGRALIALASLVDGPTTVIGRDRLPERPMSGLVDALNHLGVEASDTGGRLPVRIDGTGTLPGGRAEVDSGETTQFLTGLLLAAPLATEPLGITPTGLKGSQGYIEVTLLTMRLFGAHVERTGTGFLVQPSGYRATDLEVEPDASAAVYPMVAAAIAGGRVTIEGLGSSSMQPDMAVAGVLEQMGCDVAQDERATTVSAVAGALKAIDADMSGSPDGSLAIAVACLFADGVSRLRALGSLRFKESDRLAALATEIERLGARAVIEGDDLVIDPGELRPARVETYDDHRLAMSFGLAGLGISGVEISDPAVVNKTWPGYWAMLEGLTGDHD